MNFLSHWLQFVLILYLISKFESRKLTEKENEKRLDDCGLSSKPKVFNGRTTRIDEAPWAVMVRTDKAGGFYGHCTGTLLSPRHVLTATHCSATGDGVEWSSTDVDYPFDREKCTETDNFIVTEVTASKVTVLSRNETMLGRAKFLIMFKFCRKIVENELYDKQFPDDFMIVELSENLEYNANIQPACLARDPTDNEAGAKLDFFGYGDNPPPGVAKTPRNENEVFLPKLLSHKIYVHEMVLQGRTVHLDPRVFFAKSVTSRTIACPGDSGGGAVRKIDGRNTVVGVVMQGTCETLIRGRDGFEVLASVGFYSQDICEVTGICTPPRASSDSKFKLLVLLVILIF